MELSYMETLPDRRNTNKIKYKPQSLESASIFYEQVPQFFRSRRCFQERRADGVRFLRVLKAKLRRIEGYFDQTGAGGGG